MTKMVMIVYNEAIDMEVMEVMQKCSLKNYTKTLAAYGSGASSGIHLGDDIWPGRNNILYVACSEKETVPLMSCVKDLRKVLATEGIKAFVLPVEDLT
jgi:hypothetical protein